VEEVARLIGWNSLALLGFLVPTWGKRTALAGMVPFDTTASSATPDTTASSAAPDTTASSATPDTTASSAAPDTTASSAAPDTTASSAAPDLAASGTERTDHDGHGPLLVEDLKEEHAVLLGRHIQPLRRLFEVLCQEVQDPVLKAHFEGLNEDFEALVAELSCHFLLEEEELFPYVSALFEAVEGKTTHQNALNLMEQKSLTDSGDVHAMLRMFQHLLHSFPDHLLHDKESMVPYRSLWEKLSSFHQAWAAHEDKEEHQLLPLVLGLENRILRKN
jgi:hypothetical protein